MTIAVFADVRGRLLLALQLCERWQRDREHFSSFYSLNYQTNLPEVKKNM
ncbi:hypothetical protein [Dictyobacter formicarum]|uniref:Uncharacterized protein n=1 Tax=Dictyobacter formicarum TaxID=2778368 RepID=A0ABQ3VWM4_9CHLR|nr:hypothetical protein [Dictyobacter formicarum]GHO89696.1 hypothetical protein KSZ_77020 [Dictyobacter formicarum]